MRGAHRIKRRCSLWLTPKSLFLRLTLLFITLTATAIPSYAYDFEVNGIEYTIIDSATCCVTGYNGGYDGSMYIPETVVDREYGNEYAVTEIRLSAPYMDSQIYVSSIYIPSTVTYIDNNSFDVCEGLTAIEVNSDNLVYYSRDGVLYQRDEYGLILLRYPAAKTEEYDWGYFEVPSEVCEIAKKAFLNCNNISHISIGSGVREIGEKAFTNCYNLYEIDVAPWSWEFIVEDGVLYRASYDRETDTKTPWSLLWYPHSKADDSFSIPNTVSKIENYAFYDNKNLLSVTIPLSVKIIEEKAFEQKAFEQIEWAYYGIQEINVEEGNNDYTSIDGVLYSHYDIEPDGGWSWSGDLKLWRYPQGKQDESFSIPDDVTGIGRYAFKNSKKLHSVSIPSSVYGIRKGAFANCDYLSSINIPSYVHSIEDSVFSGCSSLQTVDIYGSVTSIGKRAFKGCGLSSFNIPESVTFIGEGAFDGCYNLSSINIPQSMTRISDYAFYGLKNLTEINIPSSVTSIGKGAFEGCGSLSYINIPTSVTSIEDYAFKDCNQLNSGGTLILPYSLKIIGKGAFAGCSGLRWLELYTNWNIECISDSTFCGSGLTEFEFPQSVKRIGNKAFANCNIDSNIYLPLELENVAPTAFISNFHDYGYGDIYDGFKIHVPNRSGDYSSVDGVLFDKDKTKLIFAPNGATKTEYIIPNTVKSIGDYAFYKSPVSSVSIPETVTSIGKCAFFDSYIKAINLPNSVTEIGCSAFSSCNALTKITIPASVTRIESHAFSYCYNLTTVTIPASVTSIGDYAFFIGEYNGAAKLSIIYVHAETPPACSANAFDEFQTANCVVYVPAGCVDKYKYADGWSQFAHIEEMKATLSEDEWNTLANIREELIDRGWAKPWDMSLGIEVAYSFEGVTIKDTHVTALSLPQSGLKGEFPWSVLDLPYMTELDLSGNYLKGDVGEGMTKWMSEHPDKTVALRTVNLSNNKLSGNIAPFANSLTQLNTLNVSGNCIADVKPQIASTVTKLNVSSQTIDRTIDVDLAHIDPAAIAEAMPTVLTYNHATQAYDKTVKLQCSNDGVALGEAWKANIFYSASSFRLDPYDYFGKYNIYKGESGDTLAVKETNGQHMLSMKLRFAPGDANFSGDVDVTDLQALILRIFDRYGSDLFNHTAANTIKDETLNVQDVVGEVNLLMQSEPIAATTEATVLAPTTKATTQAATAMVYCENGLLKIYSEEPVAAFDITVRKATSLAVAEALDNMGITCTTRQTADGVRMIGYSMSGATLPAGETVIAATDEGASVSAAVLSDITARKVHTSLNTLPTAIAGAQTGHTSVSIADGQLIISTDGTEGTVNWRAITPDGRTIDHGTLTEPGTATNALGAKGVVIVTIETDKAKTVKKLTNNK